MPSVPQAGVMLEAEQEMRMALQAGELTASSRGGGLRGAPARRTTGQGAAKIPQGAGVSSNKVIYDLRICVLIR